MSKSTSEIFRVKYPRTPFGMAAPATGIADASRSQQNGTFVNSVSWVQEPSGIWVNNFTSGLTDYVSVGTIAKMSMGLGDQSVCLWFKMTETGFVAARYLIVCGAASGTPGTPGFRIIAASSNSIQIGFCDGTLVRIMPIMSTINFYDSKYHLLSVVFDRNVQGYLYVDGIVSVSPCDITPQQGNILNELILTIGLVITSMYGRIGGVRVINRVLTPDEINRIYASERSLYGV
jgi:hypothetical protein